MAGPEVSRSRQLKLATRIALACWVISPILGGVQAAILGERSNAAVAFILLGMAVAGFVLWAVLGNLDRISTLKLGRLAFSHAAARIGFAFVPGDQPGLRALPFALLRSPGRCMNVLMGERGGRALSVFQFRKPNGPSEAPPAVVPPIYTCAVTQVARPSAAPLPHLLIRRRPSIVRVFTRRRSRGGVSGDLRKRWIVKCSDAAFASRIVGPGTEGWFLSAGKDLNFELSDRWAMCYEQRGAEAIDRVMEGLIGFAERVPDTDPWMGSGWQGDEGMSVDASGPSAPDRSRLR